MRASYRKGLGSEGLVAAGELTQLMSRPLGLKAASNPLAADGAQDPESLDDARSNAPLQGLTLDRVVSLQDYEDFARAFSGIGKALASCSWVGERNGVFLTVAGPGGAPIPETGVTYGNLIDALRAAGDPNTPLDVRSYQHRTFHVEAGLHVDPAYDHEKILAAAEAALRQGFSFDARPFGQPVAASEILAILHQIPGIVAADLDRLYRSGEPAELNPLLPSALPRPGDEAPQAAELLTLDPAPLALGVLP